MTSTMKTLHPVKAALLGGLLIALALPATVAGQVTKADEIVYPPMPDTKMPVPERVELDNGMVILLLEDNELPLIEARAVIRTGSRWEPADHVGLAGLTGQLLRSGGTQGLASDALDDLLEDRAAIIETSIGQTSGSAFMSCLSDDFDEMLQIFSDILREPVFEESKLDVAKNQMVSGIARQNDSAAQIRAREFRKLLYGAESPYARTATYATAANIDRDDLVAWHAQYYHPDRTILGLVGDFDSKEALAQVKKVFGGWKKGPKINEPEISIPKPKAGIYHVEKTDVTQGFISLGHLGIQRDNPDYHAVELMNQVMSGSFASRLFSRIRSRDGLAYSVGGGVFSQWDYTGVYQMSMSTKVETTAAGIEGLVREARLMTDEPPTEDEVEKARTALLNSFVFRADSTGEILSRQLTYEYYGYPLDWLERYRKGIETATVDQVRAAARKYINPEDFVVVVVSPSEGLDKPLDTLGVGELTMVDITIPEPEAEAVEVTAESEAAGKELIARALEGIGGAERVDAMQNMRIASTVEMISPQGSMQIKQTGTVVMPSRLHLELTLPFGSMVQVLDGDKGFVQSPQGTQNLPASQVDSLKENLNRQPVAMLRHRDHDGFSAVAMGTADLDGETLDLVRVEIDGNASTYGLDSDGKVRTIEYRGAAMGSAPGDMRQIYSDFRDVGGLMLPFASETTFNGDPLMSGTNESVEVDIEVDDALFSLPEG